MSFEATPPARATGIPPNATFQSQSGLGDQFSPSPPAERGGEEPWVPVIPWLASGGSRPRQQGLQVSRAKTWEGAGGQRGEAIL